MNVKTTKKKPNHVFFPLVGGPGGVFVDPLGLWFLCVLFCIMG